MFLLVENWIRPRNGGNVPASPNLRFTGHGALKDHRPGRSLAVMVKVYPVTGTQQETKLPNRLENCGRDRNACISAPGRNACPSPLYLVRTGGLSLPAALYRWLVDHLPVEPEVPDDIGELIELDRFDDVTVYTERIALDNIALLTR